MRARAVFLVVTLVFVVACSSGDDGAISGIGPSGGGIRGLLGSLPVPREQDELVVVAYSDLAQAAEIADVEPPNDPSDREAVVRYLNAVTGGPLSDAEDGGNGDTDGRFSPVAVVGPFAAHLERAVEMEEFAEDVGWTVLQVDRFIERQTLPHVVSVLDGRFDRDSLDDAMEETEDGVWVAGDPEVEGSNPGDVTAARPLGESLWLSLDSHRLVVTHSAEDVAASRDLDDAEDTLADNPVLAALADALDEEGVYTAMLYGGPLDATPGGREASPEQVQQLCDEGLAEAPAGVAAGLVDDGGPVIVLALAHEDVAAAEANAEAIERMIDAGNSFVSREPWSERLSVDEVTADAAMTVARLRPIEEGHSRMWREILQTHDSLVASC